jgi:hypothetical protein
MPTRSASNPPQYLSARGRPLLHAWGLLVGSLPFVALDATMPPPYARTIAYSGSSTSGASAIASASASAAASAALLAS